MNSEHRIQEEQSEILTFPCDQFPQCNNTYLNIKALKEHKESDHPPLMNERHTNDNELLREIRKYQDFYHNQINMVQLDHTGALVELGHKVSTQQTIINIFTEQCRQLMDKVDKLEQLVKHCQPTCQEQTPTPAVAHPSEHHNQPEHQPQQPSHPGVQPTNQPSHQYNQPQQPQIPQVERNVV